jgi:DNA modification methylase
VAKKYDRQSIGIEIEEAYVKIGLRRLQIQTNYNGEELKRELCRNKYSAQHTTL